MPRKTKPNVNISPSNLEDLIWMSYRYCIGRHTIAAATHADTIMSIIVSNPGVISPESIQFNASDIRSEITRCISFKENVSISGSERGKDIFSALLYSIGDFDVQANKFHFDADKMQVVAVDSLENRIKSWNSFDCDYTDLIPWVKLANWMDPSCHKTITVEYEGEVTETRCYPFPYQVRLDDGRVLYEERWAGVENPSSPSICSYLSPEFIKKIE